MDIRSNVLKEASLMSVPGRLQWAVVITTYRRQGRLLRCLSCLYGSIQRLGMPIQIVVMDSSPTQELLAVLRRYFVTWSGPISVRYVHLPGVSQSRLRNEGLRRLGSVFIQYVLFLDSDIYLSESTLEICSDYLDKHRLIAALAPPLVAYTGESYNKIRKGFGRVIQGNEAGLIMPSKLDFQLFRHRSAAFIKSHMLRGAFIIRRRCLRELFNNAPWHESFRVWQNVDLFLSLREKGKWFGYILSSRAICLHDERGHPDTIRSWMPQFHEQTIKSLILLFHRNQLWRADQRLLNRRFFETIQPIVEEHCAAPRKECLRSMLQVARSLSSGTKQQAHVALRRVYSREAISEIRTAIELLLNDEWKDIRSIRSYNLKQSM